MLSKVYKPIAGFAPSGKEWHDKAVTLSISANWNPLENPLRDDFDGDDVVGGASAHVHRVSGSLPKP